MKTIKPLRLGILHKTFEHDGKCRFVVTALVYFPLRRRLLLPEVALWQAVAEELGDMEVLDECMPKSRAEALLNGYAHPPGSGLRPACSVRMQIGDIDKTLYVVGDRHWQRGGVASDPEPFERLALGWENAFGGEGFDKNPRGKGIGRVEVEGETSHPLPNVENPKRLVGSPNDRPEPAGFGAVDVSWPQRFAKMGTYDQEWLDKLFPGYAKDIDWTFFNLSPEDQQQPRFFAPDEPFVLENLHPDEPKIEGTLPGVVTRIFVVKGESEELVEIPTRIDTVRFFPHIDRGVAVFRGVIDVVEDDAHDLTCLLAGVEEMGKPRSLDHYRTVLALRLDKEKGAIHALRDSQLTPEGYAPTKDEPPIDDIVSEHAELMHSDNLLRDRMRRQAQLQLDAMRDDLKAKGIELDEQVPTELPPIEEAPGIEQLPEYVEQQLAAAEAERKQAEEQQAKMEEQARVLCAEQGIDFDEMVDKARREAAGPPTFDARAELERLKEQAQLFRNIGKPNEEAEAKLAHPDLLDKLEEVEKQLRYAYRKLCHHMPAAAALRGEEGERLRASFEAVLDSGEAFAERDFTGVDLSELDLSKAQLQRAWLEAASLPNASLAGLDLSGAVLARADLSGADLSGCKLVGTNLGEAKLADANLSGADLSEAVLAKAQLAGANLKGCKLAKADFMEARFSATDLSGASLPGALFYRTDLSGIIARGADLSSCTFIECSLRDADLSGADLTSATFVEVDASGAQFVDACLHNARFVQNGKLDQAVFLGAELTEANFRGASLRGCDLRKAKMDRSDFSECDLREAKMDLVTAVETLFVRTDFRDAGLVGANLMNGILQKANIEGTNFRGANLFRVDFAKIRGSDTTDFEGANMKMIRFVKRQDDGAGEEG